MPNVSNCEVKSLHGGLVIGFHLDSELHNPLLDMERSEKKSGSGTQSSSGSSSIRSKNTTKNPRKAPSLSSTIDLSTQREQILCKEQCMRWVLDITAKDVQKM